MTYTFLELVKKIDVVPYPWEEEAYSRLQKSTYTLVSHDGTFRLGYLLPIVAEQFKKYPSLVSVDDGTREVRISPDLDTVELRSAKLNALAQKWREEKLFGQLKGWRDEVYTIYDPAKQPYMRLERAFCPSIGIVMYGCHITGYVVDPETKEYRVWVPRRSSTKQTYPGMLDCTVAGGMGNRLNCIDTVVKECYEEAGLPNEYVRSRVKSVGLLSYLYQPKAGDYESEEGYVQAEVEYIYDLEMDKATIPHPVDHEAEDFRLMDIPEVVRRLKNGEFKYNCAGVIIDFMMRHGLVTPESEADYIEIQSRLHRRLPFPTR